MQRRLPWSVTVETGYVGSKSDRLRNDGIANINIVPFGRDARRTRAATRTTSARIQLWRRHQRWVQHNLYSNYHSWQTLVSRQTGQFSFTGAYTFSKALGIRAGGGRTGRAARPTRSEPTARVHLRHARQRSATPAQPRLQLAAAGREDAASRTRSSANWQLSGISQWVSGVPLQLVGGDGNFRIDGTNAQGVDDQPDEHHRVARSAGDAGTDVRSSRQRRRPGQGGVLRGAGSRRTGQLRVAEHRGAVVHQPRLLGLQERRRSAATGSSSSGCRPTTCSTIRSARRTTRRTSNLNVHERRADQCSTSACCRRTTSTAIASCSWRSSSTSEDGCRADLQVRPRSDFSECRADLQVRQVAPNTGRASRLRRPALRLSTDAGANR